MRFGRVMGAGEIATVPATGMRSAIPMAIAAPIECPTRTVFVVSIRPLRLKYSIAAAVHSADFANEKESALSP